MWLFLAVLACSKQPTEPAADVVASVMIHRGSTTLSSSSGEDRQAAIGALLRREDVIRTPPDAWLILHLRNNYLVRIDDDLTLTVDDLILLDAPARTHIDGHAELAALLFPEDGDVEGRSEAERVSGWHARLGAAKSPIARRPKLGGDRSAPSAVESPSAARDTGASSATPPEEIVVSPVAAQPSPHTTAGADASMERADASTEGADAATEGADAATEGVDGEAASRPATVEALFAEGTTVHACLVGWAKSLPVPIQTLMLTVTAAETKVKWVRAGGGLTPPRACLSSVLNQPTSTPSGVSALEIRVKTD